MTASTTNYVYLDPSSSCAPAVNTTGFTSSLIPIATVVTGSSTITSITDDRTFFQQGGSSGSVVASINGAPGSFTFTGAGVSCSGTTCTFSGGGGAGANTVWNGTGAPSVGVGVNGDFYLDTSAYCMYGPKASGVWPGSCTSLVGPSWYGLTLTPVVTANWSTVGAGCSTSNVTTIGGNPGIQVTSTTGTQNACGVKTAVSGTFTHVFAFYSLISGSGNSTVEVGFSDGTKIEYCGLNYNASPAGLTVSAAKATALTGGTLSGANGLTTSATVYGSPAGPSFFRLRGSPTQLACDMSPDGVNWVTIFTDTTPFLTVSSVYFGADPRASTGVATGILASYN